MREFPDSPVVKIPCRGSNAEDTGSIPGWGIKIPHVVHTAILKKEEIASKQLLISTLMFLFHHL